MSEIERRTEFTHRMIADLRDHLDISRKLLSGVGCVYLTGSFGRLEASEGSDIDAFIACEGEGNRREVSKLSEIKIKAELISATEHCSLPDFDGDGDYLRLFTGSELVDSIGSQADDYENTFTARLLLLLEGRPLLGEDFFKMLRERIIASYWRDFGGHEDDFIPAFFANDVLRLWRTFCVNYEARTGEETEERKAKRRSKNYRLRHTRILTCYSFLSLLLDAERKRQRRDHALALAISDMTPIQRIQKLCEEDVKEAEQVLKLYARSLEISASPDFKRSFIDDAFNDQRRYESREFSEAVFALLMKVGDSTTLIKRLLV